MTGIKSKTKRRTLVGAILSVGMALAVVAITFFAWMAEEVFEGESNNLDESVRAFVHGFASPLITSVMQFFSFLGSTLFLASASVLVIAILIFIGQKRPAVIITVVMTGAVALNYILKISFFRPRPNPYFGTPLPTSFSFPSGHALFSVCFYGILAWLLSASVNDRRLKVFFWSMAVIMAIFIGASRIYLGVHYPSDVLAGYVAAFVWMSVVILADSVLRGRES